MQNMLSTLALCRRAGYLVHGFDVVKEAMEYKTAKVVILASDVSDKTKKEAIFFANRFNCPIIQTEHTIEQFWTVCSKKVAVIGICDKGFAKGFLKNYDDLRMIEG
ncbi:MAG: ribosomal L7Ae/L30e/S12e/Gadd45 family protein [Oscillospiraceae bacterium]|nr:ribosomal L7Ae/L30e/S12e/Gadd45 family protein [Oscillospiraceae bacterium]